MTHTEALKMALEALGNTWTEPNNEQYEIEKKSITAIKEALAQPEQEPVAWMNDSTPSGIFARHMEGAKNFGCTIPLYTAPPQRKWQGLTDEEIESLHYKLKVQLMGTYKTEDIYRTIEAYLKEKNT
jgi:hypothetical protein